MLVSCPKTKQQALQSLPEKETTDVTGEAAKRNLSLKMDPLRVSVLALSQACHHLSPEEYNA